MFKRILFGIAACAYSVLCWPAPPKYDALEYQPGPAGYQEIKLGERAWYVAYHGNSSHQQSWVDAAWRLRVAHLCRDSKASYFIELRYVTEPITETEKKLSALLPQRDAMLTPATWVPIFIPMPDHLSRLKWPYKMKAVRCIDNPPDLLDPSRAVSIQTSIDNAIRQGIGAER